MSGFTKLFSSIVTSSIWVEDDVILRVWIALLATADSEGRVEGSVPGFANLARVSPEQMRTAIELLSSPDPDSRTPDHEGRRIEAIEGGWQILNYSAYRERGQGKEGSRAPYMRDYRRKKKEEQERDVTRNNNVTPIVTRNTEAEAEAEAEVKTGFSLFWAVYPRKQGKEDARKAWKQMASKRPPVSEIVAKVEELRQTRDWIKDNGQFVPGAGKWLRAGGWDDEPGPAATAKRAIGDCSSQQAGDAVNRPRYGPDGLPLNRNTYEETAAP